jgi:hypothetical protein
MSMARFWRDQGKPQQARELFAPVLRLVYGRLRHAGPEGGEGAARRAGAVSRSVGPFLNQSSIPEATEKSLRNTLSLFDAVPF